LFAIDGSKLKMLALLATRSDIFLASTSWAL